MVAHRLLWIFCFYHKAELFVALLGFSGLWNVCTGGCSLWMLYLVKHLFCDFSLLHRDAIEKLFPDAIRMRVEDIQQNNDVVQSLAAFQKYGNDRSHLLDVWEAEALNLWLEHLCFMRRALGVQRSTSEAVYFTILQSQVSCMGLWVHAWVQRTLWH